MFCCVSWKILGPRFFEVISMCDACVTRSIRMQLSSSSTFFVALYFSSLGCIKIRGRLKEDFLGGRTKFRLKASRP